MIRSATCSARPAWEPTPTEPKAIARGRAAPDQTDQWRHSVCLHANGNLTSGGGSAYTWDTENRPLTISRISGSESHAYDADGEHMKVVAGSTTVYFEGFGSRPPMAHASCTTPWAARQEITLLALRTTLPPLGMPMHCSGMTLQPS